MISSEALSRILALPKNCDDSEETSDIRVLLRRQFQKAVELHQKEHDMVIDSMRVLYQLDRQNAAGNLGLTRDQYIEALGLSPDIYWKRLQAAKVLARFPEFVELFKIVERVVPGRTTPSDLWPTGPLLDKFIY